MRTRQVFNVVLKSILNKKSVLLIGDPGCGKTSIVEQVAKKLGAALLVSHAVIKEPTDYSGMPWFDTQTKQAFFAPFGDMRIATTWNEDRLLIIFFDDVGQAKTAVQAALMQILLAGTIDGQKIAPNVRFVLATNRRGNSGVGQVIDPFKARNILINVEAHLEDWIDDFAIPYGISEMMIAFLRFRRELFTQDYVKHPPSADFINTYNPRAWTKADEVITKWGLPDEVLTETVEGIVSKGPAGECVAYHKMYDALPNFDSILMSPETANIPNEPSVMYATCTGLAAKANASNLGQIVKYCHRLQEAGQGHYGVLLIRDCIQRDSSLLTSSVIRKLGTGKSQLSEIINASY